MSSIETLALAAPRPRRSSGSGPGIPANAEATASGAVHLSGLAARGGLYLGVRYGLGVLVSMGNMFLLTWWIGPHTYGTFITIVGITAFLASFSRAGVDTYLVRQTAVPSRDVFDAASTLVLGMSIALAAIGAATIPMLAWWYGTREFVPAYCVMLITIPLVGLSGPPTARLERALNFRAVARIELGGQVLALAVGLALAWRGYGVWAPVCGQLAWQAFALVGACWAAAYVPKARLDTTLARDMVRFGLGYTASLRVWQLRTLVNPLLVARLAGTEAVAFVALAIRVAEGLGFIRVAASRLAIAALSRLRLEPAKFRTALDEALQLQVVVLGPLLCGFALAAPWLIPKFMGQRWSPGVVVFPFIAAGVLVNSVYNLQASALFVLGKQWAVFRAYSAHVILLAGATVLLVPHAGLAGYGWAELAALLGYVGLQRSVVRNLAADYLEPLLWAGSFCALLAATVMTGHGRLLLWAAWLAISVMSASRLSLLRTWGSNLQKRRYARSVLTFALKFRQRGWTYVGSVLRYSWSSAVYRAAVKSERWLAGARWSGGATGASVLTWPNDSSTGHPECGAGANAHGAASHSAFHFSPEEVSNIARSVPEPIRLSVIAAADRFCEREFLFRGIRHRFAGQVDWNFTPAGNVSWRWDLNRHRWFVALSTAFVYTRQPEYLASLLSYWEHWMDANLQFVRGGSRAIPTSATAWQPFEVASRLQNWIWAYQLVQSSGLAEGRRLDRISVAMSAHARFLGAHLEFHWPNNHLLLELKSLYEFCLLFPLNPLGRRYGKAARRLLEKQILLQILPDGAHSELCSMYHRIVAGELWQLARLCRRNGQPLAPESEARISRAADFCAALTRSDGSTSLTGDSAEDDSNLRFDAGEDCNCELNYWVDPPPPAPARGRATADPKLSIFPQAGLAIFRSASTGFHLTFDAGPFSRCQTANHAHCDALSFELYANGRSLIVDPGVFFPWAEGAIGPQYFRSTPAHNTLVIDGREQSELCPFVHVRREARVKLAHSTLAEGWAQVKAECVPYWAAGSDMKHAREIVSNACDSVLVRDRVEGTGRRRLEWFFHFAWDTVAEESESGTVMLRASGSGRPLLRIGPVSGRVASETPDLALVRGQTNPPLGWLSRNSAQVFPAWVARYRLEARLPFSLEFQISILGNSSAA